MLPGEQEFLAHQDHQDLQDPLEVQVSPDYLEPLVPLVRSNILYIFVCI